MFYYADNGFYYDDYSHLTCLKSSDREWTEWAASKMLLLTFADKWMLVRSDCTGHCFNCQ